MTEKILNSLFVKNMFLYMNEEEIINSLENEMDMIKLVEAVTYSFTNSLFFSIETDRIEKLQGVISYISSCKKWNSDFMALIDAINKRCEINLNQTEETKDYHLVSYGTSEAKKRNLVTGSICVPTPGEVENYVHSDFVILSSLVTKKVIPDDYSTDQIISAISLLLNSYSALLFENPECEVVVARYLESFDLNSFKSKVFNRKDIKRIKLLIDSLYDYSITKDLAIKVNQELTKDGYFIRKNY